jgi:PIN domain nuclease of toxin-antitoxin system
MFVLAGVLLWGLPASSIAIERERIDKPSSWSSGRSPSAATTADDSKAVAKLIRDINAAAEKDKRRMLSIIVINTNVAATTLEQQKARTGLSLGDVYVAHALSLATRKKFDTIVALKAAGQSWSQIGRAHKVSLKGSTELLKEMMKNS